jgi:hypothetical protein
MFVYEWLKWCAAGVILGIFPLWWWCSSVILEMVLRKHHTVPRWMMLLVENGPGPGIFHASLSSNRYYINMFRILVMIWSIVLFALVQYFCWTRYFFSDFSYFLCLETGFLPFYFFTIIVPSIVLKKHIQKKIET